MSLGLECVRRSSFEETGTWDMGHGASSRPQELMTFDDYFALARAALILISIPCIILQSRTMGVSASPLNHFHRLRGYYRFEYRAVWIFAIGFGSLFDWIGGRPTKTVGVELMEMKSRSTLVLRQVGSLLIS